MGRTAVRVALVWNGRVLEEQIVRGGSLTLGSSPRARLQASVSGLPASFPVVTANGKSAVIRTRPEFRGRVGRAGEERPLEEVREDPERSKGNGVVQTRITPGDRALLAVGHVGVYVDFVELGEPAPRESFLDMLGFHGPLAMSLVFAVVVHLAFIVSAALMWEHAPKMTVEHIPDRYVRAAIRPPKPPRPKPAEAKPAEKPGEGGAKAEKPAEKSAAAERPAPRRRSPAVKPSERPADKVGDEGLLKAMSEAKRGAFAKIFKGGGGDAATSALATSFGAGGGPRGGPLASAGSGTRGMGDSGGGGGTSDRGGFGHATDIGGTGHGPGRGLEGKADAKLDFQFQPRQAQAEGGFLSPEQIDKVVKMNARGVKYCYENVLRHFPGVSGKVELEWVIGEGGKVEDSKVSQSTAKNHELESCLARVVGRWVFPEPQGGKCRVIYPFYFGAVK